MLESESQYQSILNSDPGNPAFVEFAEFLRRNQKLSQATDVLLSGLSCNPSLHKGRVLLARVFYERKFIPFALRELQYLSNQFPNAEHLKKLCNKLSPDSALSSPVASESSSNSKPDETIAEAEFDFDQIDMIEKDKA